MVCSPLRVRRPSTRGRLDKTESWTNQVDEKGFLQWIKQQPKNFSHFTRRLDRKVKWYFTGVDNYQELYRKYVQDFIFEEKKPMSERSFRRYLRKQCFNYRFKKSHLDDCGICFRLKELRSRAEKNKDND